MDLMNFRLIRGPRQISTVGREAVKVEGDLVTRIERELKKGSDGHKAAEKLARDWLQTAGDPIGWAEAGGTANSSGQHTLAAIGAADGWLAARADDPASDEFKRYREEAVRGSAPHLDAAPLSTARATVSNALAASFVLLGAAERRARLQRLTRLLLVLEVMDAARLTATVLDAPPPRGTVHSWLWQRPVVVPQAYSSVPGSPLVTLIRDAKVSDLFVVRSEWSCYKAGEIASIVNVLAGESLEQETRLTREEETITRTDTETLQSAEQTEEDKTQTELAREVDKAAGLQVSAEGSVDVSGQYGFTKFGASASAGVSASLAENSRQASRISRELVSKAVAKVESRVREERTHRTLTKSEDLIKHSINNSGNPHARGIYRWVDRVDRYQLFRFPDRLLFEFQLPEPAEYVRWRIDNRTRSDAASLPEPPHFDVAPTDIDEANYGNKALGWRASSVPPPPDKNLSITYAASALSSTPPPESRDTRLFAAPVIEKSGSVTIPQGYRATELDFSLGATPFRANWRVEGRSGPPVEKRIGVEGFHHITATVQAGGTVHRADHPGRGNARDFTVQLSDNIASDDRPYVHFADAVLDTSGKLTFATSVAEKVDIALHVVGAHSAAISCEIRCERTPEAFAEWQQSVYNVLLDAWRDWNQQWRTQQLQKLGPQLVGIDATSPARNRETIQEELKRQAIMWLLDDAAFPGYDDLAPASAGAWRRYVLSDAKAHAPTIQFLEQAFEWSNLTYMLYPYYWADEGRWDTLAEIQGADPEFVRFLRAGSARVIVPARPAFEQAALNWLMYQLPFHGGPMPGPDDPLYVSIATEISDLTRGPTDGDPGDCWEARLATALLYLDASADLPANNARRLGKAPNAPVDPLC
jgi:hypothetical protein